MKEPIYFVMTAVAIFALILLGAVYSPSFTQQQTYLELFFLLGSLLFIFSVLVVFAWIGFKTFALFFMLFLAIMMILFGIEGVLLISALTYTAWGFIFALEVLLFDHGVESAQVWFIQKYDFESFKKEFYAFYPVLGLLYILLELIPHILYRDRLIEFKPSDVLARMEKILK
ncbi:MAG TPA: hypothetical protein CFH81_03885 [Sulfurovum sp. UBA12169]|nr:MAG TPA: hypothetical protein CFH81_03885 [Sulfurovum sp. UBA12169]